MGRTGKVRLFFQHMESVPTTNPAAAGPGTGARLREMLRQYRFSEALAAAQAILAVSPGQRDALLATAMAQRFLGRIPEALATLETLERQHPRFSRLYEERGRCFVAQRQAAPAIEAFLKAVHLNHALPGAWGMLEGLYRMQGEPHNAATAASEVATLRRYLARPMMERSVDSPGLPWLRPYLRRHSE